MDVKGSDDLENVLAQLHSFKSQSFSQVQGFPNKIGMILYGSSAELIKSYQPFYDGCTD